MTVFISIILIALAVFFVWRVFKFASKFQPVEEPPDEVGDVDVRESGNPACNIPAVVALRAGSGPQTMVLYSRALANLRDDR
jgi:hypothetical protein